MRAIGRSFFFLLLSVLISSVNGCGGGSDGSQTHGTAFNITFGASTVVVPQNGDNVSVSVTFRGTSGTATVDVSGIPDGITQHYDASSDGSGGLLTLIGSPKAAAGSYTINVHAAIGTASGSGSFALVSAPVAVISSTVDTASGINGKLDQFMSTSFQIAPWAGDIFGSGDTAKAREKQLADLGAQHDRAQVIAGGMPMVSNTGTAADWDFSTLDMTLQPVLASGDHSPEFQIGTAPAWMCDANGHLIVSEHAEDFAAYSANLVRYYNKGGFDWGGSHFQSPSSYPITWWGIFNEYNISGLTASEYLTLYNATVPAMLAVDPTIKISAIELSDWGLGSGYAGDPMIALPTFLGTSSANGVNTQADVLSTHFYGTCNQNDADATVFAQVPTFADNVRYFYKALSENRPDLSGTQVWVTENNVNADFNDGTGHSTCNPGQVFVTDQRGTSAYFAAWRPYVFSQLGKAGNRALYHWSYSADKQYGEVDGTSNKYLSYWVDQTLAAMYPSSPTSPGQDILSVDVTDDTSIETLATRSADGSVRVMIVNRAVHSQSDNNGTGDPRTILVEPADGSTFTSASLLTIDANTDVSTGPKSVSVDPDSRILVTLNGYGVAFLTLKP